MVWYLQISSDGGREFWDNYIHRDCRILKEANQCPFGE